MLGVTTGRGEAGVAVTSKRFELTASVDAEGSMRAEGAETALTMPPGWNPDHMVLAALVQCSLTSLRYHAGRAGLTAAGGGVAHGTVERRPDDGRYALVAATVALDVTLDPPPSEEALDALLAKAERDCFVGASLRARPAYVWTVGGVLREGAVPAGEVRR